jgi:hypothetical protein
MSITSGQGELKVPQRVHAGDTVLSTWKYRCFKPDAGKSLRRPGSLVTATNKGQPAKRQA